MLIPQVVYIFITEDSCLSRKLSTLLHKVKTWGLHPRSLLPMQNRTEKAFIALCKALIMAVPFHLTQKTKVIESQIWFQTYSILRFNIRVKLSKQIFRNMICDFNVPFERLGFWRVGPGVGFEIISLSLFPVCCLYYYIYGYK